MGPPALILLGETTTIPPTTVTPGPSTTSLEVFTEDLPPAEEPACYFLKDITDPDGNDTGILFVGTPFLRIMWPTVPLLV